MAQVILLERVDNLGDLGEVVNVKPGFARNFLIPQNKALRASPANIAYFEAQKADIVKANDAKKAAAQKEAKKVEGVKPVIVRHAAEGGQLYGSVNARDIAEVVTQASGVKIARGMVTINDAFKTIGFFPVEIALHPEVRVEIKVNIARSEDEAKIQEKTGEAVIIQSENEIKAQKAAEKAAEAAAKAAEEVFEEGAAPVEADAEASEEAEETAKAADEAPEETAETEEKKEA